MSADDENFIISNPDELRIVRSDSVEAVKERVFAIIKQIEKNYVMLGREMYVIFHRRLYLDMGYSTFYECIEREFGSSISRERADRVKRVWTKFIKELSIRPDEMSKVFYSRAYALLPVVNSDNVDGLLEKAKTLSAGDFNDHIELLKGRPRAISKARETAAVVEETTIEITGSPVDPLQPSESGRMPVIASDEPITPVERPTKLTFNLYPSQLEVVQAAIQEVQRGKASGMPPNEALANVALECMAARMTKEDDPNALVSFYLRQFERAYGGKFVWFTDPRAVEVVSAAIDQHPDLFE